MIFNVSYSGKPIRVLSVQGYACACSQMARLHGPVLMPTAPVTCRRHPALVLTALCSHYAQTVELAESQRQRPIARP